MRDSSRLKTRKNELLIDNDAKPTLHQHILTADERALHYSDVAKIIDRLNEVMRYEDEDKIRQIFISAPHDYQPDNKLDLTDNLLPEACSHVA